MKNIKSDIYRSRPFEELKILNANLQAGSPAYLQGVSGSLMAFITARLFEERDTQVLLVVPESGRAEQLRDDSALLLGESQVRLFTRGDDRRVQLLDMTAPIAQTETLQSLVRNERILVVSSAEALAARVPLPHQFSQRMLHIENGKQHPFEKLLETLIGLGFERKDFVEEYGDFAVRGGILDVFPFVGEHPVRIEFWGDAVESIREFDVLSQRSIRSLEAARIVARLTSDSDSGSLFSYLQENSLLLFDEPTLIQREIEELRREGIENIFGWDGIQQELQRFPAIFHSKISAAHSAPLHFGSSPQPPFGGSVKRLVETLNSLSAQGYSWYIACDTQQEVERLKELMEEEITEPERDAQHLSEFNDSIAADLVQADFDVGLIRSLSEQSSSFLTDALHSGFIYPAAQLAVFTEHGIFGRQKRRSLSRKTRFKGFSAKEIYRLHRGDFVVHQEYGVGKFVGLQKITLRGVEQEVMKVLYQNDDALYVNLDYISRVQKYSSREGHVPKLNKLGAPDWERLKSRALKKIKDIARDLIKLYARRKLEKGFAFSPDTHWQKEMEASFMYDDTPDQAKATLEVKADMESSSPMDRLICGDVGFGKTEIAVRAAFKAVLDGKQMAILVPTTILAQQHYNTFLDRLGRYSVRIESLTRFKAKKDQKLVLHAVSEGHVDILIGTHRILSSDVVFKNLGLLVIDEEQHFGVSAKEKLRQVRASIDTLTLTATPIPRTLHFSLMGARDLSIINTPPRNRLPIITEIAEFDQRLIREAILKELHRGGQVYVVHDRVRSIDPICSMLEEHIPEARFHVAHGQMQGHELEKTMMDFLEKKYDVLICTKIIESGIDIPSVNTIIINRADRFGLAELYQLRGRVGRSNEQAYAYLLTPPLSSLPRASLRRLQAIQEFTELGSGFNLAMRDLEIRGAGNLLGAQQSGFILEMGFETYQRIVEEAIAELKEEEFQEMFGKEVAGAGNQRLDTIVETDIEALIPDFYIGADSERLDIYRRLYKVQKLEDVQTMREELRDRFGEYPVEVEHVFEMIELKTIATRIGLTKIELRGNECSLLFPPHDRKDFYEEAEGKASTFQGIMNRVAELKRFDPRIKQTGNQLRLLVKMEDGLDAQGRLQRISEFLKALL